MKSCNDCPLRETCTRPCAEIEAQLPDPDEARMIMSSRRARRNFVTMRQNLTIARRHVSSLRGRERRVFTMMYEEGLAPSEVARSMKLSRARVSEIHRNLWRTIGRSLK